MFSPRGALVCILWIQLNSTRSLKYLDFSPIGWACINSTICISTSSRPLCPGRLKYLPISLFGLL